MNLSFAGCGFLGIYHVGVAVCFKKYAPHLLLNKISGASAGAVAACCLLCDLPIGEITSDVLNLIREARLRFLGPFSPSFNVQNCLLEGLQKVLPGDAHLRVNGKLHISLTRVYDGRNVIVSQFDSREDLLQALLASAFVPIFSGLVPPRFHGVRYIDGGFSDNLPTLDENTITVSPFCGETDICPRDLSSQLFHVNLANTSIELSKQNIYRFARILWPPKPEVLSNMCKQGFDDALRFLHRNNLINCTRCLAVQSTFVVSETLDESIEYDPQCQECKLHRQEALVANLPDTVMTLFQEAVDTANKGLVNWVYNHRGMKLLSILSLPYTIPADITFAVFNKLMSIPPYMVRKLVVLSKFFVDQLAHLLHKVNKKRQQMSANITCQLSLSQYGRGYSQEMDRDATIHVKNKNFNFTLNLDERDMDESGKFSTNKILSRRPSFTLEGRAGAGVGEDDTFENILQVTAHHEAIMAFYYMDDENKMKVTEIFDVTGTAEELAIRESIVTDEEAGNGRSELRSPMWFRLHSHEITGSEAEEDNTSLSCSSSCDEDPGSCIVFSDPESEWSAQAGAATNSNSSFKCASDSADLRPECEQSTSQPIT